MFNFPSSDQRVVSRIIVVSRTRMSAGHVCVGGFDVLNGYNVRLMTPSGENQGVDSPLAVFTVIDATYSKPTQLKPPHTEDVRLISFDIIDITIDQLLSYRRLFSLVSGPIERNFSGALSAEGSKSLSVREGNVPDHSVCFWRIDSPLFFDHDYFKRFNKKVYGYRFDRSRLRIPFVGLQETIGIIPASTIVRLSLARWWKPEDADHADRRCQLQLSGWYL